MCGVQSVQLAYVSQYPSRSDHQSIRHQHHASNLYWLAFTTVSLIYYTFRISALCIALNVIY